MITGIVIFAPVVSALKAAVVWAWPYILTALQHIAIWFFNVVVVWLIYDVIWCRFIRGFLGKRLTRTLTGLLLFSALLYSISSFSQQIVTWTVGVAEKFISLIMPEIVHDKTGFLATDQQIIIAAYLKCADSWIPITETLYCVNLYFTSWVTMLALSFAFNRLFPFLAVEGQSTTEPMASGWFRNRKK